MNMARKIYPSQKRYTDRNPNINFHVKREDKERIDKMVELSGKKRSELLRVALFGLEKDFSKAYEKAHSEGYENGFADAKKTYRIWYQCNICDDNIELVPNSDAHKAMIDYMKNERWGHPKCH